MFCQECGTKNRRSAKYCRACGQALYDKDSPPSGPSASPLSPEAAILSAPEVRLEERYVLGEVLGRGGMGVVYRAHDPALDRPVAIKLLSEKLSRDPDFIEHFFKEARIAARLRHPNIVSIHEVGRTARGYCYVMDFIDGETLSGIVRRRGSLSFEDASRVLIDVSRAIAYAHELSILHRDLKPQNVMIDRQGNVIIMDFGLARAIDDYSAKTRTDGGIESPLYMSPEQMERRPLHHQSDIFSLGLIYYFLLSGKHFFRGKTASSIVKHMRTLPFREAVASSGVPAAAVPILQRMLERDPELRAKDLGEIVTAVKDALHGHIAVPNLTDLSATAARTRQEDPVDRVRRTRERLRGLLERVDSAS